MPKHATMHNYWGLFQSTDKHLSVEKQKRTVFAFAVNAINRRLKNENNNIYILKRFKRQNKNKNCFGSEIYPRAERRFHAYSFCMHSLTLTHWRAFARPRTCMHSMHLLGAFCACVFDFVPHLDSVLKLMFIIVVSI